MGEKGILVVFFAIFGLFCNAQNEDFSKIDLYGCWVMENDNSRDLIYKPCESIARERIIKSSEFYLFSDGTCEFQVLKPDRMNCKRLTQAMKGTWTYDQTSKILNLSYPNGYKHESWKKFEETFPQFNLPDIKYKAQFSIVDLDKAHIEVERYYGENLE